MEKTSELFVTSNFFYLIVLISEESCQFFVRKVIAIPYCRIGSGPLENNVISTVGIDSYVSQWDQTQAFYRSVAHWLDRHKLWEEYCTLYPMQKIQAVSVTL